MNCQECKSLLFDYVLGECNATSNQEVSAHLAKCDPCEQESQRIRRQATIYTALERKLVEFEQIQVSEDVTKRIAQLSSTRNKSFGEVVSSLVNGIMSQVRSPVFAGALALLLIGILSIWYITPFPHSQQRTVEVADLRPFVTGDPELILASSKSIARFAKGPAYSSHMPHIAVLAAMLVDPETPITEGRRFRCLTAVLTPSSIGSLQIASTSLILDLERGLVATAVDTGQSPLFLAPLNLSVNEAETRIQVNNEILLTTEVLGTDADSGISILRASALADPALAGSVDSASRFARDLAESTITYLVELREGNDPIVEDSVDIIEQPGTGLVLADAAFEEVFHKFQPGAVLFNLNADVLGMVVKDGRSSSRMISANSLDAMLQKIQNDHAVVTHPASTSQSEDSSWLTSVGSFEFLLRTSGVTVAAKSRTDLPFGTILEIDSDRDGKIDFSTHSAHPGLLRLGPWPTSQTPPPRN